MEKRLPLALMFMRFSIFLVMIVWTLDKFIRPTHATGIFAKFYFISGIGPGLMYLLAAIELVIILAFLFGIFKRLSYGLVFIFTLVSTLSTFPAYFTPFSGMHLMFFAAWPMLATSFALYYLRHHDTLLCFHKKTG